MPKYNFPVPRPRGNVAKSNPICEDNTSDAACANDLILYSLLGRMAATDGSTIEFETIFNPSINALELEIPDEYLEGIESIGVGPRLQRFLDWLRQGSADASEIDYDSSVSGLAASDVQEAIDVVASNVPIDQDNIIYVGKHGNDDNDGANINSAFLTFTAALVEAANQLNTAVDPVVVVCLDSGIYNENLAPADNVHIYAPNAKLEGNEPGPVLTLADNGIYTFREISLDTVAGFNAVLSKSDGSGTAEIRVDRIEVSGTGFTFGLLNSSGIVLFDFGILNMASISGFGIGDNTTADQDHIHVRGRDVYLTNTNIAVVGFGIGSTIVGSVEHILERPLASGTTTGFNVSDDSVVDMNVGTLTCDTAYTVSSGTLNLIVNNISGTETVSGTGVANIIRPNTQFTTVSGTTYDVLLSDRIVLADGNSTINLTSAALSTGKMLDIKNTGTGTITIDGAGADMIDGDTSVTITSQFDSVTIVSDGTQWWIL